jgi:hypothetical protein
MVRAVYTILGCLLISMSSYAAPTKLECQSSTNNFESNLSELEKVAKEVDECPAPTKSQYSSVCHSIYEKQSLANPKPGVSYGYQESIWELSCAVPGVDTIETAKTKIQKMWNKYRTSFRCYDYPTLQASEKNIAKFSLDTGFTTFLTEAVKRYDLDMNFVDPGDNKTLLDFIQDQEKIIRNSPPIDTGRANEYNRIYKMFRDKGAKHAKEL